MLSKKKKMFSNAKIQLHLFRSNKHIGLIAHLFAIFVEYNTMQKVNLKLPVLLHYLIPYLLAGENVHDSEERNNMRLM